MADPDSKITIESITSPHRTERVDRAKYAKRVIARDTTKPVRLFRVAAKAARLS